MTVVVLLLLLHDRAVSESDPSVLWLSQLGSQNAHSAAVTWMCESYRSLPAGSVQLTRKRNGPPGCHELGKTLVQPFRSGTAAEQMTGGCQRSRFAKRRIDIKLTCRYDFIATFCIAITAESRATEPATQLQLILFLSLVALCVPAHRTPASAHGEGSCVNSIKFKQRQSDRRNETDRANELQRQQLQCYAGCR